MQTSYLTVIMNLVQIRHWHFVFPFYDHVMLVGFSSVWAIFSFIQSRFYLSNPLTYPLGLQSWIDTLNFFFLRVKTTEF
jgi:hypothetical protein